MKRDDVRGLFQNQPIPLTGCFKTAVQLSIWEERLLTRIKEKRWSVSNLSEKCNLQPLQVRDDLDKRFGRYAFSKLKNAWTRHDRLKSFLFVDDGLKSFDSGEQENISRKLECWLDHPSAPETGLVGRVDTQKLFPTDLLGGRDSTIVLRIAQEAGFADPNGFITNKGLKLRRVQGLLRRVQNGEYQIASLLY